MNRYKKTSVITTGTDSVELDNPTFEIVNININTVSNLLSIEIMHEVSQGSLTQKHSRTFDVKFKDLSSSVKLTGRNFLQAIENKILELPQYSGGVKQ